MDWFKINSTSFSFIGGKTIKITTSNTQTLCKKKKQLIRKDERRFFFYTAKCQLINPLLLQIYSLGKTFVSGGSEACQIQSIPYISFSSSPFLSPPKTRGLPVPSPVTKFKDPALILCKWTHPCHTCHQCSGSDR